MREVFKGKLATTLIVLATVVLAGVAVYTAFRLYALRDQGVALNAPESEPLAWDCSKYNFNVDAAGLVTVTNDSKRDESAQQVKIYVNGSMVATLDVPALLGGASATLGTVQVPQGGFSWRATGTRDCEDSGTIAGACTLLTFTITLNTPTLTPTLPPDITATLTPTEPPVGGISPTNTPIPTVTPGLTVTPTLPPPPSIPTPPNCDSLKPIAPTLVSVNRSGTSATLTWTAVELATHYVISYGTSPTNLQYGVPNTGNVTTYTVNSLSANTQYYFTVYAVNSCMPSDGAELVPGAVVGTTTSSGALPNAGSGVVTVVAFAFGIALITFALLLAI